MERFAACFAELVDPREDNARHALVEILMIALCAMLCGAEDCSDMALFGRAKEAFLSQFLKLHHGIPSHDTFSRMFRLLDPAQFQLCFPRFMDDIVAYTATCACAATAERNRSHGAAELHFRILWSDSDCSRAILG
jgi:hypothetical protein